MKKITVLVVRIFQNGAMVNRTAKTTLNPGMQEVVIDGLSPYINPESITLKGTGDATILSVSYQQNYLQESKKSAEIIALEDQLDTVNYKIQQSQNKTSVINETILVLQANKSIGGANNGVMADELEPVVNYFSKKMTELKDDLLQIAGKEKKLREQAEKLRKQLAVLNSKQNQPTGNIIIAVDAKTKTAAGFTFSYAISNNVSWTSSYDLRAKDINSPIVVDYKAKVTQNTGEDWENVKLKLSTGNPSQSGNKQELHPWYLNIFTPMAYQPNVMGGARTMSAAPAMQKAEMSADEKANDMTTAPVVVEDNQLNSDFDIAIPYSIPSNGREYQVAIQQYTIAAEFNYVATPKLEIDAFLIAKVTGWEDLSLTPGPANVYFDGAYVGETYLDPSSTNDTLQLSLGRDKRIIIKRDKLKEFSSSKFFGSTRQRDYTYEISVKNGKSEPISIIIEDQLPISQNKDIEVKTQELSGADYNSESGMVKWKLSIQPNETQKKKLSFSVKYPKDKQITGM
jgi:uncharacterized protein (TIGR02231 family)